MKTLHVRLRRATVAVLCNSSVVFGCCAPLAAVMLALGAPIVVAPFIAAAVVVVLATGSK